MNRMPINFSGTANAHFTHWLYARNAWRYLLDNYMTWHTNPSYNILIIHRGTNNENFIRKWTLFFLPHKKKKSLFRKHLLKYVERYAMGFVEWSCLCECIIHAYVQVCLLTMQIVCDNSLFRIMHWTEI